jgi:hypothetical protein
MPQVGFEPTIPVFEWAKTFYVLERAVPYNYSKNIGDGDDDDDKDN